MFRRVAGRRDYCGDRNHWAAIGELLEPDRLAVRIRRDLHLPNPGTPPLRLVACGVNRWKCLSPVPASRGRRPIMSTASWRSEERRVAKECVRTCRYSVYAYRLKKKEIISKICKQSQLVICS